MSDIAHDKGLPATFLKDFHNEESVRQMTYNRLGRTDMVVSALSYGASALGSVFRNTDDTEGLKVVEYVIKNGVNYIDVAPWYGHGKAEQVLGRALQTIPRSSYFISTKVGRYLPEIDKMFDFGAERTIRSVDESLARLGLEKVDLVQVHDIEFADNIDIIINETLPALQKVKDSGKARYIGITGYPLNILKEVLERSSIQKNGTGVINASPVSMGLLTERGAPDWHPASDDVKRSCAEAAVYCRQMGTDLSRVALSYSLDLPLPTTLFSSASLINAKKNLDAIFMPLTDTERKTKEEIMKRTPLEISHFVACMGIPRYMRPLKNENWEGVEEDEYWAVMRGDKTTATKLG
ncbi:L-galactose dehydrogenase-like isoform X3 [Mizuhopecten yessoensis]|uniref:L-galactose dehydrogenase-like isoform X3 n=1 Tax=Mizuhopecten yessoensis TaxID=6573 RepID=UPI000B45F64E|nr:L-galactose dehydrogenase-like isoform X3 [Mizuhopecten yessoensis]